MKGTELTPAEFAYFVLGMRTLYDWQIECLEAIGLQEWGGPPVAVAAANGSGKTTNLIAPAVAWFLRRYPRGKVVLTSGSFNQLQNQLWPAIKRFGDRFDWKINHGNSPCTVTTEEGGRAIGFSTNDPGRAEGWHPTFGHEIDPVFLIVDEAKSVPVEIYEAFSRCTRMFQLWVSSPGAPEGKFYDAFTHLRAMFWTRRVRSDECPHIDPRKRERDGIEFGEGSAVYRSMHLAEFTSLDDRVVLSAEELAQGIATQEKADTCGEVVAFCDFAAGGDENVLAVRRGNELRLVRAWREEDPVQAARQFARLFREQDLEGAQIWGDADGLGVVMLAELKECGFVLRPFHGGARAQRPEHYANLIAEVWIEGCREIARGKVHLGMLDEATSRQLTKRRLEYDAKGRLRLESKESMRSRGVRSPDRADALLGAIMCGARMSGAITREMVRGIELPGNDFAVEPLRW